MPLPPSFLDELRARLPLSEVISKRMTLTRAGREFKGCCPFHNEKTPSFYVNDQKGFFHCFGCGAHGDIIGFVMRHDRYAFPEAIEHLAQQAGMEVPRLSYEEVEKAKEQKTLHQLCETACAFFEQQLRGARGRGALDYLKGRGLEDEAISRFRLGYAPSDSSALIKHLEKAGFPLAQIMEVGLARQSEERGRGPYSFFRDRVMFPVADRRGRVVAFGGRIMSGEGPKYINSPDHPLFHKGQLLYSLARAREVGPKGQPIIVVEGYMDVIALVEAGFGAAVAPLGTALTELQMEELWKIGGTAGDPILCFDGDSAGQRAASRALERCLPLLGAHRSFRFAFLPQGQDPDDLIKAEGQAAMQLVLDQAIPLIDMLWREETEGKVIDTPEARAGVKANLYKRIERIGDPETRDFYKSELTQRLSATFGWGRRQATKNTPRPVARHLPPAQEVQFQRLINLALLRQPGLYADWSEQLMALNIAGPLDNLWQAVVTTLETSPGVDTAGLQNHLCAQGFADQIEQLLNDRSAANNRWTREAAPIEDVERGLRTTLAVIRMSQLMSEISELAKMRELDEVALARLVALRREYAEAEAAALPYDE